MDELNTTLRVEARMIGKRQPFDAPWQVTLSPDMLCTATDTGHGILLRDLIAALVRAETQAFRLRQQERRILHVLSAQEINNAARTGKVSMGGEEELVVPVEVNEDEAVQVALQAFEDGIYLVFLDGQPQRHLDSSVQLRPESYLLFIRLVALVGG
ncbi:hypothetical protein KSD_76860 [Ktedonobacter sp. SOSP1-85]|uniref:hypothetical protein n=1 Tax=Ktedonobacter sp. SOSP1-85 TaxID=2778367 RepID=UPI001A361C2B|nr:hypothetical protein [Ktedonobacter sp. SOSP1-85]GHO79915.1 hypothetical protein KSD_76860 [Ktedonobacter sp. SOSP1-85]